MTDNGMVTISVDRYEKLLKDEEFLNKLYEAGVDNWEGYSYACFINSQEDTEEDV